MATDAGVALEDDVAALVDSETVILVMDRAARGHSDPGITSRWRAAHLFSMTRSVVLTSKPSVLWPAGFPSLFELG